MSFVSRDFKPRRSPAPTGPRKVPLLRILLLVGTVVLLWNSREELSKRISNPLPWIQSFWTPSPAEPTPVVLSRSDRLALAGGKRFRLKQGSIQESWRIQTLVRMQGVLEFYEDERIQTLVRTLSAVHRTPFRSGVLDLVFRDTTKGQLPLFARFADSSGSRAIFRMPLHPEGREYRYIDVSTQCIWLEPCPVDPLAGGVVPIEADFDFGGREYLLTHDLFRGIGETPVVAVLPGVIRDMRSDSARGSWIEIQHSNNQSSRSLGLAAVAEGLQVGDRVEQGQAIGRLSARDTVELMFQFRRNGQFVRWESFLRESRPLDPRVIATFQKNLQL